MGRWPRLPVCHNPPGVASVRRTCPDPVHSDGQRCYGDGHSPPSAAGQGLLMELGRQLVANTAIPMEQIGGAF